ncbi:Apolipoprotein L4 [Holothuria leucospilota]|uniref:Netrin receptor UNC5 n=1 Tax=Holothuria leucospilota TaxID=206669 RepID=A0A9Q1CSS2_HOLLE|nr:Apolipoprotein L4 [Holothuria leucospilota]
MDSVDEQNGEELETRRDIQNRRYDDETMQREETFSDERNPFPDLYKQQIIDENGGDIILEEAKIELHIPRGALTEPQLIGLEVKAGNDGLSSGANPSTSTTPIVTCATEGEKFKAPVTLKMPHCAVLDDLALHKPMATYFIQDRKKGEVREIKPCQITERHCQVSATCLSNVEVILRDVNKKRMRFVPFARVYNDTLVIRIWFINDLYSEYSILKHQQEQFGFVMLGYKCFQMHCLGDFLMKLKLVGCDNNKQKRRKKINGDMLLRKSKHCFFFRFTIDRHVLPRDITITVSKGEDEETAYKLQQKLNDHALWVPSRDQRDTDHETATVAEVLAYCEELSTLLLTWTFTKLKKELLFPSETIAILNDIANKYEKRRRIKSAGIIGGSIAGITGGVLAIVGTALIPLTFGASVGLIASGVAIGVAGSGVNIGFSIDKLIKDKSTKKDIETKLAQFKLFQTNFMTALSNIILIKGAIKSIHMSLSIDERQKQISDVDTLNNVKNFIKRHEIGDKFSVDNITQMLSEIISQSEQILETLCTVEEKFELDVIGKKDNSFQSMLLYRDIIQAFGLTYESNANFIGFVINYLKLENRPVADTVQSVAMITEAGSNVAAKGGVIGTRIAARAAAVADVSDDIARVAGGAAKMAKGFAVASFVLGGVGIAADVGFLGHVIYELARKVELSEGLRAICDLMKTINHWQSLESS